MTYEVKFLTNQGELPNYNSTQHKADTETTPDNDHIETMQGGGTRLASNAAASGGCNDDEGTLGDGCNRW
uniref:Uncharacterized protein n=1 Tax=Oryza punctata TaxID=4537 RepID=A0A0E0M5V2_ORYPU